MAIGFSDVRQVGSQKWRNSSIFGRPMRADGRASLPRLFGHLNSRRTFPSGSDVQNLMVTRAKERPWESMRGFKGLAQRISRFQSCLASAGPGAAPISVKNEES